MKAELDPSLPMRKPNLTLCTQNLYSAQDQPTTEFPRQEVKA